jgi:hypothetical protein
MNVNVSKSQTASNDSSNSNVGRQPMNSAVAAEQVAHANTRDTVMPLKIMYVQQQWLTTKKPNARKHCIQIRNLQHSKNAKPVKA